MKFRHSIHSISVSELIRSILDTSLDLWSDPNDIQLTEITTGDQSLFEDFERIGDDIRKATSAVLPECDFRHD